ncbi:Glycosyl transferase isoform 1 [Tripterygium wilfordii]|uniref:Glycosyltransferases n=1 Tax=Tripterygium wilfordii TaxID=458696 RepID=A0A7J7DPI3_TRIWF|nr:probable beta-1,4-xylosyltransferase IRX9H [Tripterygium wilfordii]KAF5748255.1 Glycosyl transferase isoform 1 [Tripterygium wilfordii]
MASIRRTLSPVPRAGNSMNGEVCQVPSSLSKSSSSSQNYPPSGGLLCSLLGLSDSQALVLGVFSLRSSKPLERSKSKGQVWRRSLLHFFICFVVGSFIGLTPLMKLSMNYMSKCQAFSFDMVPGVGKFQNYDSAISSRTTLMGSQAVEKNVTLRPLVNEQELEVEISGGVENNVTLQVRVNEQEQNAGISDDAISNQSLPQDSTLALQKLLIIVTPTYPRLFQAYYLNRLAQTLKLVQPPLLWIVVEMTSQSMETADLLRRTGVMYRHLVCNKNLSDIRDRSVHQRNEALSHIETHHLDGIVYFADDTNIYLADLFEQLRQIRQFGTWPVAKLSGSMNKAFLGGPICNGTQIIGWHINESNRRFRRFHTEMTGFAFNSTILWDQKRWHRPTLEPVRQLDTVRNGLQVSTFIEQLVEDESKMEGLPEGCSRIMVWQLHLETSNFFYPPKWLMKDNLDAIVPLMLNS